MDGRVASTQKRLGGALGCWRLSQNYLYVLTWRQFSLPQWHARETLMCRTNIQVTFPVIFRRATISVQPMWKSIHKTWNFDGAWLCPQAWWWQTSQVHRMWQRLLQALRLAAALHWHTFWLETVSVSSLWSVQLLMMCQKSAIHATNVPLGKNE